MLRYLPAIVVALATVTHAKAAADVPCDRLDACIEAMHGLARDGSLDGRGMSREGSALSRRILSHPGAVEAMIPLLRHADARIATLAAYTLGDAPDIDPGFLPQISAGLDRGIAWLPRALGRMASDDAAALAVDRYLASRDAPNNQEAYAVESSGRRAVPFIVARAGCAPEPCTERTHHLLGMALARMGPARGDAAAGLMRIARDRAVSWETTRGVLLMIAELGEDGRGLEADLLHEREQAPHLAGWIDHALVGIGSSAAGAIFAARLEAGPDLAALRDLARTGRAGRDAGPAVLRIMAQRPALRAAGARTLGYIGYEPAVPALISLLQDRDDPAAGWAAAQSLGRLRAPASLPALDAMADAHWYRPVRESARRAAQAVRAGADDGEGVGAAPASGPGFAREFFAFRSIGRELRRCRRHAEPVVRESRRGKLASGRDAGRLARLAYPGEVVSYGAADEDAQRASGADVVRVGPDNMVEHRRAIEQVPHVALRVADGWLAGSSRGEWGGELVFIPDHGPVQYVLDDNVGNIVRLGERIVATTGLDHLGPGVGRVVELAQGRDGRWRAEPWRWLPAVADGSWPLAGGGLLVDMAPGGSVVIAADGGMRMARCLD